MNQFPAVRSTALALERAGQVQGQVVVCELFPDMDVPNGELEGVAGAHAVGLTRVVHVAGVVPTQDDAVPSVEVAMIPDRSAE